LGNVVVCGGGACLPGIGGAGQLNEDAFPDRLREEIEAIVHQHTLGWRVKVTSPSMTERAVTSWLGGSILGSLGTFPDMWISKRDYEEFGSAIVNRKCP
jgi:actin-related protein